MHRSLILLEVKIPVEPVIHEIWCVDFVRHLKLPLVEDFLEHSSSQHLVSGFPGSRIGDVIGSGYRWERPENKKQK